MGTAAGSDQGRRRLPELDALRGLAACTVVLHHFWYMFINLRVHGTALTVWNRLHVLYGGHEAVMLFFILSGFVLSLPYIAGRGQSYPVFLCRRVFRIYFPYLAALALAVCGNLIWHGPLGLTVWANETWLHPVDWKMVFAHVGFIGVYPQAVFNTAFWSLVIEARVSIIFPLLCIAMLRIRSGVAILLALICSLAASAAAAHVGGDWKQTMDTPYYMGLFIVGIVLARNRFEIERILGGLGRWISAAFLVIALVGYTYGRTITESLAGRWLHASELDLVRRDWLSGLSAALILCLAMSWPPMTRWLLRGIPQFLGHISYSVYLVHGTVLFALAFMFGDRWAWWQILPLYLVLVFALSWAMYRLVEKPCMEWGRRVSARWMPAKA